MSLRIKLAFSLFMAVAVFLGLDHFVRSYRFRGTSEAFEKARGEAQVSRVDAALAGVESDLDSALLNSGPDAARLIRSLGDDQPHVDVVCLIDSTGEVKAYAGRDPETKERLEVREIPQEALSNGHPFMTGWGEGTLPRGFISTEAGPIYVTSTLLGKGKDAELLVVGRVLTSGALKSLSLEARCAFDLVPLHGGIPANVEGQLIMQDAGPQVAFHEAQDAELVAFGLIYDVHGLPFGVSSTAVDRADLMIFEEYSRERDRSDLLSSLGVALLFPLSLLLLVQALVTGPLKRLTEHARKIGRSEDMGQRLDLNGSGEIVLLAKEFDRMLDELERSRLEQQQMARFAGRADVAAGIMHTVGNLANSIAVSSNLTKDSLASIKVEDLRAVYNELIEHREDLNAYVLDDERGRHVLDFFGQLVEQMEASVELGATEAKSVMVGVDQITDLVMALSQEDRCDKISDRVVLDREIDDLVENLRSGSDQGSRFAGLIRASMAPSIVAKLDRQLFLEIVQVLLTNAVEAMSEDAPNHQMLRVELDLKDSCTASIRVSDNGIGIAPYRLAEVFGQGTSTKDSRRGLGLHQASIAATKLGGALTAHSDGIGQGATFILELPIEETAARQAA